MQSQRDCRTLGRKIQITTAHNNGRSLADSGSGHLVIESVNESVLTRSTRLEKGTNLQSRFRKLQLGDVLRLVHLLGNEVGPTELGAEFKLHHSRIYRLKASKK